jgi:hypothetical protein
MGAHRARANSTGLTKVEPASRASAIRPRLRIGPVNDPLEHEADRVAEAVVSNQALGSGERSGAARIQRSGAGCQGEEHDTVRLLREETDDIEDEDEVIRMKSAAAAGDDGSKSSARDAASAVSAGGQPLSHRARAYFEPRFGRDLSDVRIHTHPRARRSVDALGARAYALGRDIAFAAAEYAPQSPEGRRLIAHELAHVLQQSQRSAPMVPQFDGFNQTMRFNRRLRYTGGGFGPHNFSPDLRATIREWAGRNLRVFTSLRPHDSIANGLVREFTELARQLGNGLSLTSGTRYRFRATVHVSGESITLSGLSINGMTAPSAATDESEAQQPTDDPRERLTPELRSWHNALMTSFYSFHSDGTEEFRAVFRTQSGSEPELLSWQRVSITEGSRRLRSPQTPPESFSRSFASSVELLLGFAGDEPARRQIVVRRSNRSWSTESVRTLPEPRPGGDPDADLVLDRQALYGQILEDWRRQTREAFTEATIMVATVAGREVIFWYAGGAVVGILGRAFRGMPVLSNLLKRRALQPIAEAAGELAGREGDEFVRLWNRFVQSGGGLAPRETARLTELAAKVEARLATRAVASTLSRAEMHTFIETMFRENPVLNQLVRARSMSGTAQRKEMLNVLDRFFREARVPHEVVEDGVVQAARGAGNFASLNAKPGTLLIERSAYESTEQLSRELTHELAHYYSGIRGRIPILRDSSFNAQDILELAIQNGGRWPL